MVLLPGCVCCGCEYPYKASTAGVEVTVESTGADVYWGLGVQSTVSACPCSVAAGTYGRVEGYGSYRPPSGVFSLAQFSGGNFRYEDSLVFLSITLFSSGADRFSFQANTVPRVITFRTYPGVDCTAGIPDMRPPSGAGVLLSGTYGCSISQSCSERLYTCAAPWSPAISGYSTPTVNQCPTSASPFAEFGFSTYAQAKDVAASEAAWASTVPGCGAVSTVGYEGGTAGTAQPATFKITSIKVLYSDGTPDLELMPA